MQTALDLNCLYVFEAFMACLGIYFAASAVYLFFVSSIREDLKFSKFASAISAIHVVGKLQQIKEALRFSLVRVEKRVMVLTS
jgi:hypothetical protein